MCMLVALSLLDSSVSLEESKWSPGKFLLTVSGLVILYLDNSNNTSWLVITITVFIATLKPYISFYRKILLPVFQIFSLLYNA